MWDRLLWVTALLCVASTKAQYCDNDMWSPSNVKEVYVINGQDAVVGQFPHNALVIADGSHICGGSLISEKLVLTAAHCIFRRKKFTVRLGGVHRKQEEPTRWTHVSTRARHHPQYNRKNSNNDVAVIFLTEAPPLSSNIKPVTLPSIFEVNESFVGRYAFLTGWGRTAFHHGCSEILQWTEVQVISNRRCKVHYEPGRVVESTLCAHDIHTSACYGDSGGPLVLKTGRRYKQIGVVSFGPKRCETYIPTAYARVTSFVEWIAAVENMKT